MENCVSNEKLPPNWIKKESRSHPDKFYYHNTVTKKSVWKLSDLPIQKTKAENVKVTKTPNKQLSSISHESKTIKRNIAENRLSNLNKVLSKEVINEIKKDQKLYTQNNISTSESSKSGIKSYTQSCSRQSFSIKPVVKKNLAQQRLKNLTSTLNVESEFQGGSSSIKRKSEPFVNNDIFASKRLTNINDQDDHFTCNRSTTININTNNFTTMSSTANNYSTNNFTPKSTTIKDKNGHSTPNRSTTSNFNLDPSKMIQSPLKTSVQERLVVNNDVMMLDVSGDINTEDTDDKMDWEEIPVEKIVEQVQNVRNNQDSSSMSSNDKVTTSHKNVQHSEDHFYCVIDTNVFLSNLDYIKLIMSKKFHCK